MNDKQLKQTSDIFVTRRLTVDIPRACQYFYTFGSRIIFNSCSQCILFKPKNNIFFEIYIFFFIFFFLRALDQNQPIVSKIDPKHNISNNKKVTIHADKTDERLPCPTRHPLPTVSNRQETHSLR